MKRLPDDRPARVEPTRKRAVLYARVSTDEQAEHGYSLPSQLEAMRLYAAQHDFAVPGPEYEIADDTSGAKLSRPGLDRVRALIDRREVEAVIVYSPDRLTRNLAHSLLLREEWQRAGIELHYCNRGKSENTPESRMTENIEAVFGDYWRAKIIEGSARGRRAKAASGKWPCDGHAAYGYRKEGLARDAHLAIDEAEAAVVRRIFALYAGRDGHPVTLQAIAAALTAEHVPAPNRGSGRKHPGQGWHRETVRTIVGRRAYIGELHYGGHTIHAPELAIVDPHLFAAAQKRRAQSRAVGAQPRRYEYLLSGHLRCSCDLGMSGQPQQRGRYLYYGCNAATNHRHMRHCDEKLVRADMADAVVWEWLLGLLCDESKLDKGLREMAQHREVEAQSTRARLAMVDDLLAEAERRIKRLAGAFGEEQDETIAAALQAEMKQAGRERTALQAERASLFAELTAGALTEADRQMIRELAAGVRARLGVPTFDKKRTLMNVLDVRVRLEWQAGRRGVRVLCGLTLNTSAKQEPNRKPNADSAGEWLSLTEVRGPSSFTTTT